MNDAEEFRKDREEQFGGEISFLSYATFLGSASSKELKNRGGIVYLINDVLHYEDFESSTGLLLLFNQREKYIKTEFSVNMSDISIIKNVKDKDARSCIQGSVNEHEILLAGSGIFSFLSKSVLQVIVENRASIFLDFLDKEGFVALINEFMLKSE